MSIEDIRRIGQDLVDLGGPVLVIAIIGSAVVVGLSRITASPVPRTLVWFPFAFSILGGISGAIAGASSEALVGALVTGVLGIVSALLSYAFATTDNVEARAVIPPIIVLLLLSALAGLSVGQNWKRKWDAYNTEMAEYRERYNNIWVPVTREYQLKVLEKCLAENINSSEASRRCRHAVLFPDFN